MKLKCLGLSLACALCLPLSATQINFTGGTVTRNDTSTVVTNGTFNSDNVKKYEEGGFRLEFFGTTTAFTTNVGTYYGGSNDVIHGHWATGDFGGMTKIMVTKIDNSAFDLNFFLLTSNTATGGAPASGTERAFIHASTDGINESFKQLLPPENWGFPATQIFLGSQFDSIKAFWFTAENNVDCFGMDNFFIDEDAPPPDGVPEPGTFVLFGAGIGALALRMRKR